LPSIGSMDSATRLPAATASITDAGRRHCRHPQKCRRWMSAGHRVGLETAAFALDIEVADDLFVTICPMATMICSASTIARSFSSKAGLKRFWSSKIRVQRLSSMPVTEPLPRMRLGPHPLRILMLSARSLRSPPCRRASHVAVRGRPFRHSWRPGEARSGPRPPPRCPPMTSTRSFTMASWPKRIHAEIPHRAGRP